MGSGSFSEEPESMGCSILRVSVFSMISRAVSVVTSGSGVTMGIDVTTGIDDSAVFVVSVLIFLGPLKTLAVPGISSRFSIVEDL